MLCLALVVVLGGLYGLCQNGQWAPGGSDDAFYLDIARNLLHSGEYEANGIPVVIIPPGWPVVLAGAMKISDSFVLLNLLPMAFMLGAAGVWYYVLRRLASPRTSFVIMLITGMLFQWERLSFQVFSDGLFCLLLGVSLLLALQMSEGRRAGRRIVGLVVLSSLMVMVRWAGVVAWFPVAGALLGGQSRPRLNRLWATAVLTGVVVAGTFLGLRFAIRENIETHYQESLNPAERASARVALDQDTRRIGMVLNARKAVSSTAVLATGNWMITLLWPPAELGAISLATRIVICVAGWMLLGVLGARVWKGIRSLQWVWLGVVLYYFALSFGYRSQTCRYLVPVAPLLVLGLWEGSMILRGALRQQGLKRAVLVTATLLAASVVVCNLGVFTMTAWVLRSKDFVREWQAGEYEQMLGVAARLKEVPVADGEIAVNSSYTNMDHPSSYRHATRMLTLATGRQIQVIPRKVCEGPPTQGLLDWCHEQNIRYYVYRPPVNPWRIWHMRVPKLQQWVTGAPPGETNPYYVLYRLDDDHFVEMDLPEVSSGLERVPPVR